MPLLCVDGKKYSLEETETKENDVHEGSSTRQKKISIETENDVADYKKNSIPDKPIFAEESCHWFRLDKNGNEKNENHDWVKDDVTEDKYCEHKIWLRCVTNWNNKCNEIGKPSNPQNLLEKLQGKESNKQVCLITSGEEKDTVEIDEECEDRDRKPGDPEFDEHLIFFLISSQGDHIVNTDKDADKANKHFQLVKPQGFLQGVVSLELTLKIRAFLLHHIACSVLH